jgi:hypothetical protein
MESFLKIYQKLFNGLKVKDINYGQQFEINQC